MIKSTQTITMLWIFASVPLVLCADMKEGTTLSDLPTIEDAHSPLHYGSQMLEMRVSRSTCATQKTKNFEIEEYIEEENEKTAYMGTTAYTRITQYFDHLSTLAFVSNEIGLDKNDEILVQLENLDATQSRSFIDGRTHEELNDWLNSHAQTKKKIFQTLMRHGPGMLVHLAKQMMVNKVAVSFMHLVPNEMHQDTLLRMITFLMFALSLKSLEISAVELFDHLNRMHVDNLSMNTLPFIVKYWFSHDVSVDFIIGLCGDEQFVTDREMAIFFAYSLPSGSTNGMMNKILSQGSLRVRVLLVDGLMHAMETAIGGEVLIGRKKVICDSLFGNAMTNDVEESVESLKELLESVDRAIGGFEILIQRRLESFENFSAELAKARTFDAESGGDIIQFAWNSSVFEIESLSFQKHSLVSMKLLIYNYLNGLLEQNGLVELLLSASFTLRRSLIALKSDLHTLRHGGQSDENSTCYPKFFLRYWDGYLMNAMLQAGQERDWIKQEGETMISRICSVLNCLSKVFHSYALIMMHLPWRFGYGYMSNSIRIDHPLRYEHLLHLSNGTVETSDELLILEMNKYASEIYSGMHSKRNVRMLGRFVAHYCGTWYMGQVEEEILKSDQLGNDIEDRIRAMIRADVNANMVATSCEFQAAPKRNLVVDSAETAAVKITKNPTEITTDVSHVLILGDGAKQLASNTISLRASNRKCAQRLNKHLNSNKAIPQSKAPAKTRRSNDGAPDARSTSKRRPSETLSRPAPCTLLTCAQTTFFRKTETHRNLIERNSEKYVFENMQLVKVRDGICASISDEYASIYFPRLRLTENQMITLCQIFRRRNLPELQGGHRTEIRIKSLLHAIAMGGCGKVSDTGLGFSLKIVRGTKFLGKHVWHRWHRGNEPPIIGLRGYLTEAMMSPEEFQRLTTKSDV